MKKTEKGKERKKSGETIFLAKSPKYLTKIVKKVFTAQQKNIFLNDVNSLFLCNSYF